MTDARQIILVDLDNTRFGETGGLPCPAVGPVESEDWLESTGNPPEVDPSRSPAVVVFAMNLDTALDPELEYPKLAAFAERLARVVGRTSLLGHEIALTLPVKESADKALERLLFDAPVAGHAGPLEAVHVISADRGLKFEIGRQIGTESYRRLRCRGDLVRAWEAQEADAEPRRRRQTPRPRPALVAAGAPPTAPWCAIDTPELAEWAKSRPVELPAEASLRHLASLVRRRPGLLTQIGLTRNSVRSIARHEDLARGQVPMFGPCSRHDDLELCGEDVPMGLYEDAGESPLGAGAVRFAVPRFATVRTSLPPVVIGAVTGKFEVDRPGMLDDGRALAKIDEATLEAQTFKVSFRGHSRGIVAEILSDFGRSLSAWWAKGRKTKSKYRIRGPSVAGRKPFEVDAVATLVKDGRKRAVSIRSPLRGAVAVTLANDLPPGHLGLATAQGATVAVLAHQGAPCTAGSHVCQAVQELDTNFLLGVYPNLRNNLDDLQQLPVMVPV